MRRLILILLLATAVFAAAPSITRVAVVPNESVRHMGAAFLPVTLSVNFTDADDPTADSLTVSWQVRKSGTIYGTYSATAAKVTTYDFISNYTLTPGSSWPLGWYEASVTVSDGSAQATSGFDRRLRLNGTSSLSLRPAFGGRSATRYVLLKNGTRTEKVRLKVTVW